MRFQDLGVVSGVLARQPRCFHYVSGSFGFQSRHLRTQSRQRVENFWFPNLRKGVKNSDRIEHHDVGKLLVETGYLRQAYSGIFHMLPLGLRVQNKLEALIDKHMQSISASKLSLSSITSQKLWGQSGRLDNNSEFFRLKDRKDARWLLAPTHEEEITTLVKALVHAGDDLPLRLYQVSRKYRDEKRPRGGLLRGREFLMKDLYTFDKTEAYAHDTYDQVRQAYNNLFSELNIPYIEARADSGNMGGTKSHEFHFPSSLGEDNLITCSKCDYAKNEEFVPPLEVTVNDLNTDVSAQLDELTTPVAFQAFVSNDKTSLVKVLFKKELFRTSTTTANPFVVKKCLEQYVNVDTGIEDPESTFSKGKGKMVYYVFDDSVPVKVVYQIYEADIRWREENSYEAVILHVSSQGPDKELLLRKNSGDLCPECAHNGGDGTLRVTKAIEVAHTFHLGTRYSSKFDLRVPGPDQEKGLVEMGCHGIGVSRLIAAAASAMSDEKGLVWPRVIAPFEVVIMTLQGRENHERLQNIANQIYDELSSDSRNPVDAIIDDRDGPGPGWKFKDATLIGYPVIVAVGTRWQQDGLVEIECRRLDLKERVPLKEVTSRVRQVLAQL